MNSISGMIASFLVNCVWQISMVAGAGWLVSRLLNRLGPRVEHLTWVFTLGLAILTPAIPLLHWLTTLLFVPHPAGARPEIAFAASQGSSLNLSNACVLPAVLLLPLIVLYAGSLLYFAARLVWSLHYTTMLVRNAHPAALTRDQEEIWRRCKQSFSLGRSHILTSPLISGQPTILFWLANTGTA